MRPNTVEAHPDHPCQMDPAPAPALLEVADVRCHFDVSPPLLNRVLQGRERQVVRAVDGVSFAVERGETLALVGESGCGKSTIARLIVGLYQPTGGGIRYDGADLTNGRKSSLARVRARRMQMIFQDPYASLNPSWRVRNIVAEPIRQLRLARSKAEVVERVDELLEQVGLSAAAANSYPHEFSGGQRQRISIARALAGDPEFLVCDEPTSALDVSVQAQILNLMKRLQKRHSLTSIFISHNLAVVRYMADRVGVMYLGKICEIADTESLFRRPRHPYTRLLLESVPKLDMSTRDREQVDGEAPNPINPPSGCAFHPRCRFADDRCKAEVPTSIVDQGSLVACHAVEEGRLTEAGT